MNIFLAVVLFLIGAPIIGLIAYMMIHLISYLKEWLDDKYDDLRVRYGDYGFLNGL